MSKILARQPVPAIPVGLHGLWGSFFARAHGAAMTRPFVRGLRSRIEVRVGEPVAAEAATPQTLYDKVAALLP